MSIAVVAPYNFIIRQLNIYVNSSSFFAGIIGDILNVLIFLSLRTFRQSSCAFYLTIMSLVNIGYLLFGILPNIILIIFGIEASDKSLFYCRSRYFISTVCTTISLTCFCLATIDQCCATCSCPRLQQWCHIKLAKRIVIFVIIFWILHATPYLFLFYHQISPATGQITCIMTNKIYIFYRTYIIVLILFGVLPVSVSILFGILAYRNVKQLAHYTAPLVRRELDKQLTTMVLTQVVVNSSVLIPYVIMCLVQLQITVNDPIIQSQVQLIYVITYVINGIYYACSLYIYVIVSERFRRQFIHVFFKTYSNCCKSKPRMPNNQIQPLA